MILCLGCYFLCFLLVLIILLFDCFTAVCCFEVWVYVFGIVWFGLTDFCFTFEVLVIGLFCDLGVAYVCFRLFSCLLSLILVV